jgi:cell division protein FtsX
MFVSTADFEAHFRELQGKPPYDILALQLKSPLEWSAFRADWDARLKEGAFPCRLNDPATILKQMDDRSTDQFMRSSPLVLGLAGVATICIIITTLSLGLRNRLYTLAMLRAIGAERRHVFMLILTEGVLVSAVGCILGILGGWGALLIMASQTPAAFPNGVALDGATIVSAVICAVLGVAGAAMFPCVQAARMRPLDVLQELYVERRRVSVLRTALGVLFLLPAPVLALHIPIEAALRCKLLLYAALPALVIGCVLIAPLAVVLAERLFGSIVCRLAGLNPKLLSQPLSRQMGRAVGTAITISVGLGLYTAIETWGGSMTKPFLPSPGFPDVIVSFTPNGIDTNRAAAVLATQGFRPGEAFPFECEQFLLDDPTLDRIRSNKEYELQQNNVLLLGVDPEKGFGGSHPVFSFKFVEGSSAEAARRLAAGGACVIPTMFADQSRFGLGDKIGLRVPVVSQEGGTNAVTGERIQALEIVGIAEMNWHLISARAGLRGQDGKPFSTLSPVFVSYAQSRDVTAHSNVVKFIWANMTDDLRALQVEDATTELQGRVTRAITPVGPGGRPGMGGAFGGGGPGASAPGSTEGGMPAAPGVDAEGRRGPRPAGAPEGGVAPGLAHGDGEGRQGPPPGMGAGGPGGMSGAPEGGMRRGRGGFGRGGGPQNFVQVSYRDFVLSGTSKHADDIISGMSRIPLWALAILSLCIVNAVVASIQTRRVEIGRMRAIGLSRSQLLRLVCLEGILIGFAVALLSLAFGVESGWCFTGYTRGTMAFGGLPISFQLPWAHLAMANLLALGLALAAAIIPALLISRKEPAALLHSGAQ